tara:strand:- start:965 stop:1861 length:897 start_codon:yes stop_codon:yes gene_type:complete
MDFPDNERKSHSTPVSAAGGLIIFPYIFSSLIYLNFLSFIKLKILLIWMFLYISFFITGFIDDKIRLNAKSKTFILLFVLFIVIPLDAGLMVSILDFKDINQVILLNQGSLFFTIFCIYFFYNFLNFSDGLNGISLTLGLYFILVIIFARSENNIFYYSILISLFLILIPNLMGKIFVGNSGISFLSCVLFLIFIDTYNKNYIFFDEIILIVFLPAIDAARITIERIMDGDSPFKSDKNHFHHLLVKIVKKEYVFLPYLIFATLPYLITKINITTYVSLIIFSILYFIILFLLKKKNV